MAINLDRSKMANRNLSSQEKQYILNRDGWCCNRCGYIPFHSFDDVPSWAKRSYAGLCEFAHDIEIRPPVIFVTWEKIQDNSVGDIHYKFDWLHGGELEYDHIEPINAGGSLNLKNVQTLCHECHRIKTSMESRYTTSAKYTIHKFMGRLGVIP